MSAVAGQLKQVQEILTKSTRIICQNLDPKPLLLTMKTEGALTPDDVTLIKNEVTASQQAEKMLDILIKKPATAYNIFMTALLEAKRKDLYDEIKVIEKKIGYVSADLTMDSFSKIEKIKKILTDSTMIICDNLAPKPLLLTMQTKGALTIYDVKLIKSKVIEYDQVESLLDILMKKPATSYDIFMEALLEAERKDLYVHIKTIEIKHGYVKTDLTMDSPSKKIKKILTESTIIICDNLDPQTLLFTMKTKGALTAYDITLIQRKVQKSDQAELLLDILMKRPATSYDIFMEALLEAERKDLYDQIKAIEMKHGYVKTDVTMDPFNLKKIRKILTESISNICDNLDPKPLLLTMKTKGALTFNDVKLVKSKVLESDQADLLLDILMKRPATSYDIFMEALLEAERKDLYDQIKAIEMKHGYVKTEAASSATGAASSATVVQESDTIKPSDFTDFVGEFLADELSNVYERLDISYRNVQKAHERANSTDPDTKAKAVLRFWHEQNGTNATRRKLLKALKECQYIHALETLQEKWGYMSIV